MLRILLYLVLSLYQCVFVQCQIDFAWDQEMIKKDPDFKCGIENKYKPVPASKPVPKPVSRVLNGKRTSNIRYPWMVEGIRVLKSDDGKKQQVYFCGGSVISDKSILTAAHCLCTTPEQVDIKEFDSTVICLEEPDDTSATGFNEIPNQNRVVNQIHYSIGSMKIFYDIKDKLHDMTAFVFNANIKAFVYKYEPKWRREGSEEEKFMKRLKYKNGDIGLIIDTSAFGLNLKANEAIPICLPSSQIFQPEFKVTAVGRGRLYNEETTPRPTIKKVTTCMTNEGVVKRREPQYAHIKETFLQ